MDAKVSVLAAKIFLQQAYRAFVVESIEPS